MISEKTDAGSRSSSAVQRTAREKCCPKDIVAEQAHGIQRLRIENKLLRDFLCLQLHRKEMSAR